MLENESQRVLEAQQQKYLEEHPDGSLTVHDPSSSSKSPSSPSGNSKKNKKNGNGNAPGHVKNKPSYAEVAAGEVSAKGTTTVSPPTRLPNTAHLAKDLGIPSRPNPFHLFLGLPSNSRRFNYLSWAINTLLILLCLDFQFTPKFFLDVKDTTFVRVGAVSENSVKLVARIPESLLSSSSHSTPSYLNTQPVSISEPVVTPVSEEGEKQLNDTVSGRLHGGSILQSILAGSHDHPHHRRHAATSQQPIDEQSHLAKIVYRASRPAGAWHYAGSPSPSPSTDYVSTLTLSGLLPNTQYEYALVLPEEHQNKFITPNIEHPHHFKTAPDPKLSVHQTHFTFAASSCIKPGFPYVPGQDHLSIQGAKELADRIGPDHIEFLVSRTNAEFKKGQLETDTDANSFSFVLTSNYSSCSGVILQMFMGDFVYSDVPSKTSSTDGYYKLYRQNFASKDYRRIYENIPTYHIYDDHEIINVSFRCLAGRPRITDAQLISDRTTPVKATIALHHSKWPHQPIMPISDLETQILPRMEQTIIPFNTATPLSLCGI